MRTVRNFIDGNAVDAIDGRRAELIDPVTGEVFGSTPVSNNSDVDTAYRAAAVAFETWRDARPAGSAGVRRGSRRRRTSRPCPGRARRARHRG